MSTCDCEKQDGYANCCKVKRLSEEREVLLTIMEKLNSENEHLKLACGGALNTLMLHPHVDKQQAIDYLREILGVQDNGTEFHKV